jgi:hypothetical protein
VRDLQGEGNRRVTTTDPHLVALLDQVSAAGRDAASTLTDMAAIAHRYGMAATTTWSTFHPVELAIVTRLVERMGTGQLTTCPHLTPNPGPRWWAAWAPGRLRCPQCTAMACARMAGTREEHRCDACRRRARIIHTWARTLPPLRATDDTGRTSVVGPIIATAGFCTGCAPQQAQPITPGGPR